MSQTFTSPFTGDIIQPTDVSFNALTLTASETTQLQWSTYANTNDAVAARIMHVTPGGSGASLGLPNATQAATASDLLVYNTSSTTSFLVKDASGTVLCTMNPGVYRYFYLTDNTTTAGVWYSAIYGSGSATVPISQIAGYGIDTANGLLNTAYPIVISSDAPTITSTSRATFYVYTGGSISTPVLPSASVVGNDFFVVLRNNGTGALTFQTTGTDTVDSSGTLTLNIGDACVLVSGGSTNTWYTFGKGRNQQFQYNVLTEDVGIASIPGNTYTLSTVEASNTIQIYTDVAKTRTNNLKIFLPNTIQTYFISNQTGQTSYNLQFQLVGSGSGTGTTVDLGNALQATVFSDGSNLYNANTVPVSGSSSSIQLSNGSYSAPSLAFITNTGTGLYLAGSGILGIASAGAAAGTISAAGISSPGTGTFEGGISGGSF
jgi:hypothetical protein